MNPPTFEPGHQMSLACTDGCLEHAGAIVPLGICWWCRNPVEGPDPWTFLTLAERGQRIVHKFHGRDMTPEAIVAWIEGLRWSRTPPSVDEGWQYFPGAVIPQTVHRRCHHAGWETPYADDEIECVQCAHYLGKRGQSIPARCPECETPFEPELEDDEDDEDDDQA